MSVRSLYPNLSGKSSASTGNGSLTEDRLNLFCHSSWDKITKSYDVETLQYNECLTGSLPSNADDARWLVVGTSTYAVTGIGNVNLGSGVSLVMLIDQSYSRYGELVSQSGAGYYFYLMEDTAGDLLSYLQSVHGGTDDFRWYADDNGALGDLIKVANIIYHDDEYVIEQFYEIETHTEGYYKNLTTYFGDDATNHYIDDADLNNITYQLNGTSYNGSSAWADADGTGTELTRRAESLLDVDGFDLIIYNGKIWSNTEYANNDDGFTDYAGSCIVLWLCSDNIINDFMITDLSDETAVIKHEMHNNFVLQVPYIDEVYAPTVVQYQSSGEYKNKGYLLGLPAVGDTEELNSDFHITAEIVLPYRKGTLTCELSYVTDGDISFMQGIAEINSGRYLYIRAMDNALFEYTTDTTLFSGFTANDGTSAVAMFVADINTITDNDLHEVIDNVISYAWSESGTVVYLSEITKVMINTPSQNNMGGTGSTETTTGWQPDPLWTDIRDLYDNDTLASTYTYRAVYLISASDSTTTLKAGARYITSDGYDSTTELTTDYTHTWDTADDMIDSNGAYTRWIKVYSADSIGLNVYNFNQTVLWVVYNLGTTILGGSTSYDYKYFSNCKALQCVELGSNITVISNNSFYYCSALKKVIIPSTVTTITSEAFYLCYGFENFDIPTGITAIPSIFIRSYALDTVIIPDTITTIGNDAFKYCYNIRHIELPNTLTSMGTNVFQRAYACTSVTLENGFNCNGLDLQDCTKISVQVAVAMFTALFDRSSLTAYTLTIPTEVYNQLTTTQLAIASDKNWSVVGA